MSTTPAAKWRENGEADPHGSYYDGERAALCNGHMTDDELANEVYLSPGIANLAAAKERIRWLSRALARSQQKLGFTEIALDHKSTLLDSCEKALAERDERIKDLQRDAGRYEFLRDEDNWGEDSGDDCWEALGEAHYLAFDEIVDSRIKSLSDDDGSFDNAL